ncbi:hypothetical protein D9613_003426 [Agrocybe pediades]|uniref:Uncharacterized protein n=1 Tax=Agrocybe pediades TaxID=84607 RepID=A0A8H4QQG6_9AGAR|nr:hypothetical protein D9613_003426 [Agrocybe pediades]
MSGSQKARWGRYLYDNMDKPDSGPPPIDLGDVSFSKKYRGKGVDKFIGDKTKIFELILGKIPDPHWSDAVASFEPKDLPDSVMKDVMVKKSFEPLFQKLEELGVFLESPPVTKKIRTHNNHLFDIPWKAQYVGNAHKHLLENIKFFMRTAMREFTYITYGNIVQSSGYGKSRTVHELPTLGVPTIPINIRPAVESRGGAYPPPDEAVTYIFERIKKQQYQKQLPWKQWAYMAVHIFLQVLFEEFKNIVTLANPGPDSPNLAMDIRDYLEMNDNRCLFYDIVKTKVLQRFEKGGVNTHKTITDLMALKTTLKDPPLVIMYIDEAHPMTERIEAPHSTGFNLKYLDDTLYAIFLEAVSELRGKGLFVLFLSTISLSTVSQLEIEMPNPVYNSRRFQPNPGSQAPAPFTEMPFDCHRDLVENGGIDCRTLYLKDVQSISSMARFGRPLFWSTLDACADLPQFDELDVRRMANTKLSRLSYYKQWGVSREVKEEHKATIRLAVLDILLSLHYDPLKLHNCSRGRHIHYDMIAGHMRTAFSIPKDRETFMHSGYPSEPILAGAAMDLVCHYGPNGIDQMAQMFLSVDRYISGAIDKGERGENVGKMILLTAYMKAMSDSEDGRKGWLPNWHDGCSLVDFLKHLTAEKYHSVVLECLPDNVPRRSNGGERDEDDTTNTDSTDLGKRRRGETSNANDASGVQLEEAFKDSWVRFTHFVRGADDFVLTSSMAWLAMTRGMAMIGSSSQEGIDVHIPILLHKDKQISESNMSAILVRFESRSQASNKAKVVISQESVPYFPPPDSTRDPHGSSKLFVDEDDDQIGTPEEHRSRPYISLVMELGVYTGKDVKPSIPRFIMKHLDDPTTDSMPVQTHQPRQPSIVEALPNLNLSNKRPRRTNTAYRTHPTHPRYSLFFYGCSSQVYRVIPKGSTDHKTLLNVDSLFSDYPDERRVEGVFQLKPFWCADRAVLSWAKTSFGIADKSVNLNAEYVASGLDDEEDGTEGEI